MSYETNRGSSCRCVWRPKKAGGAISPHPLALVHGRNRPELDTCITMTSSYDNKKIGDSATEPLSSNELQEAIAIEVYDSAGSRQALGDLIDGKRSILVFTRHFC